MTHDVPWLRVAPANGLDDAKQLTVGAYVNGMSVGTHTGTITITAPGVAAKTVPVTFTVTAPASGLVGAWGFDETSGATDRRRVRHGQHGHAVRRHAHHRGASAARSRSTASTTGSPSPTPRPST